MKQVMVALLLAAFATLLGCRREGSRETSSPRPEFPEPPEEASQEAKAIVDALGQEEYGAIYARFKPQLKKRWPEETFVTHMSEIRKGVGEEWSPNRQGYVVSYFPKKFQFAFNLTDAWISEYSLTLALVDENGEYWVSDVQATMLLKDSSVTNALQKACEQFLSLLAEGKTDQARKLCSRRARGLLARLFWKKLGNVYADLEKRGETKFKFHRWFVSGMWLDQVTVMETEAEIPHLQVQFGPTKEGGLIVEGFAYGTGMRF